MRASRYPLVVAAFVVAASLTHRILLWLSWGDPALALVVAAIIGSQVGIVLWHREAPKTPLPTVQLCLGVTLSITALLFSLAFQFLTGWLTYPEVTIPIST